MTAREDRELSVSPESPNEVPPAGAAGARARAWRWLRPRLTVANIITVLVLVYATPILLPHLGAVFGVRSGPDVVPRYSYVALDGAPVDADSLRGRVVLVNFWATWCLPCRAEMPALESMYQRHREAGFVIVGLAVDQAATDKVAAFVRERGITYPIVHVGREAERAFGGVRGYPTSFLLDRSGRVRHVVQGPIGAVSLEAAVRRELGRSTP
jgi:cytochrome c biogenesis protein CcmG, thiol:disulfide interchange protein DsbE